MVTQKLKLQQKLQQKLSPQQIQVIKLLESTTLELEERVRQEVEDNPALEVSSELPDQMDASSSEDTPVDLSLGDYSNEDDIPPYKLEADNKSGREKKEDIPFSAGMSFHESLIEQLGLRDLSQKQRLIAEYIIGNIDEEGYLRRDLSAISDDLLFQVNVDAPENELEEILKIIQDFEPVGVGARTLQECLLIQLRKKPETALAVRVVESYFNEFAYRHYDRIAKESGIGEDELKTVVREITMLNPKPGNAFSTPLENRKDTIVPDFIVEQNDRELSVSLNGRNVPELKVNAGFSEMVEDYSGNKENQTRDRKDAILFIKQKLDSAKWFIDAVKQRRTTLLSVMNAIIGFQRAFFIDGDEASLKPMILKDVAERTGYDISTVSRVSNSKYVQTNFGIYPLKYFFSESMQTEDGEEISSREIKKILSECIRAEDKLKPLTDDKLTDILQEKGYVIARRTVAKYREQLNIPVARLRREIL
ncbi:MAG: RNA polymerase factor sigma-54 [Candidatus Azobacteroides sp.]|nr:RNA polymerase factor sigma-54 [Candidatus Azobacteroides sp.]